MGGIVDSVFGGGEKAPDPYAIAQAQSQANIDAARVTAALNRANQYTPWGQLTWTQDPSRGPDAWNQTISLDPQSQALLDQQRAQQLQLGGVVDSTISSIQSMGPVGELNLPGGAMPTSNEDYRRQIQDALYSQATSRLDPMFRQREGDLQSSLAAQGITQGSQAYDREMQNMNLARNDAYQTALNNAITQGESAVAGQFGRDMQGRQQGTQEAIADWQSRLQGRGQVFNELASLRQGTQLQTPQFGSTQSGASVAPADVSGNVWNAYNANQAQQTSQRQGLFGLANAGLTAYGLGLFSDRRLKSNIQRIGTHPLGIGLYEYDIFGKRQRGVMADEVEQVLPSAVTTHPSGFKMVDYSQL